MRDLWPDFRFAVRTLRKNREFSIAAILTLALGIGANLAMFTVIRAVLLKPLGYRDPDRVVQISGGATIARFEELKAAQQSYREVGASFCCPPGTTLSGPEGPESLKAQPVSANFLNILGVPPLVGRGFLPSEDVPGGPRVAMISFDLWQRRFQADANISGKSATLGAAAYTIVGVLPPGFAFPSVGIDVWVTRPEEYLNATSPMLRPFGRLQPGVTFSQASAEMAVLLQQYRAAHPGMLDGKADASTAVTPLKQALVSNVQSTLWMLGGAVGLVLLIACANVAGLLLARASSRAREFAVRGALGAARSQLIRQLVVESFLLASPGGAFGFLLGELGLRWITSMEAFNVPRAAEIRLDGMVVVFTAALSLLTGVIFGLVPSLSAWRADLIAVLRASGEAGKSPAHRRSTFGLNARGGLVLAQVAISMILLTGATLLIQSMVRLRRVNPGFNTSNLLSMRIVLPRTRYDTDAKQMAFYNELVRRVEALPGIRSAALTFTSPFSGYALTPIQPVAQGAIPLNQRVLAMVQNVSPDYFRTLEIPLKRGRLFTARDDATSPLTVVLNQALARKLWTAYPNGINPIGQRVLIGDKNIPVEVVGIAADAHQWLIAESTPAMYRPLAQMTNAQAFLVRTDGDPLRYANAVRAQVQSIDRDQAVSSVQSMEAMVDAEVGQNRVILTLLVIFAVAATVLALTGIYGVIAYSVTQRTQEVGIRLALGAQYVDILRLVLGQGLGLTLAGIALGIGGAVALTRFLASLLFQTSPTSPATLAGVAILFLAVALAAAFIPARRAARIDPMSASR